MTTKLPGWMQHYSKQCHTIIHEDYFIGSFLSFHGEEELSLQYWYTNKPKPSPKAKVIAPVLR